jgi:tetratricopeptide (TPR) repeat protein
MAHYRDPGRAVVLFQQAAELYETAGDRAEAVAARGRGAFATALAGRAEEALPALQEVCEALHALHDQDCATARQVAGALAARARVRLLTLPDAADQDRAGTELEREIGDLLAFAEAHRTEDRMASRIAEALLLLGQVRSGRGEQQAAAEHFARSAEIHHEDGLSWYASEPEAMLARASLDLGDLETAERSARAALDHGAEVLEPAGSAQLHMMLADIFAGTGRDPEAAEHALEAAHWADEAGESEGLGGWARLVLGGAFHRLGRQAEAASVLEAVLPDLERVHGEGQVVQARWWLGECLAGLGEHRDAAEQFLQAAGIARDWEEQQDHAVLANLAADALNRAGLDDQAVQAYQRAEELWRALGRPHAVVRTLRARAWIALREGREGAEAGRSLMSAAEQACVSALAAATDRHEQEHLRAELAGTHRQTGELLVRACGGEPGGEDDDGTAHTAYETALGCAEQAIAQFAACGAAFRDERTGAQLMAAWLEADLGRRAEAAGRARTVLEEYGEEDGETAEQRRSEAESVIAHTARSD